MTNISFILNSDLPKNDVKSACSFSIRRSGQYLSVNFKCISKLPQFFLIRFVLAQNSHHKPFTCVSHGEFLCLQLICVFDIGIDFICVYRLFTFQKSQEYIYFFRNTLKKPYMASALTLKYNFHPPPSITRHSEPDSIGVVLSRFDLLKYSIEREIFHHDTWD